MNKDTIVAIATALSNSGISIIRVSGEDALKIINLIFKSPSNKSIFDYNSNTINYGYIIENNEIIDEVMVSIMRSPNSYTKEDVVEVNTHGGVYITKKVLNLILKNGARLAEPGEFTKRAFLNGRIDLSKAEAIMDLINAENEIALKSGINQLRGELFDTIVNLRKKIIYEIAYIESAIDDPEHISLDGYYEKLKYVIDDIYSELNTLSKSFNNGKIIKEGIETLILGRPNVGKSSLMNYLLGEDRAIVTDIEGTTRDSLEESIKLDNVILKLIDTAGIRDTSDLVEKKGVERALNYINNANLILFVIDSSKSLVKSDYDIMKLIVGKKVIVIFNKIDLSPILKKEEIIEKMISYGHRIDNISIVSVSAKERCGINDIKNVINDLFYGGHIDISNEVLITNMRHKEAIDNSINSLDLVKDSINNSMPEDFITIDMMNAYINLGYIIGEEIGDDLVNEIFSKFCMGK